MSSIAQVNLYDSGLTASSLNNVVKNAGRLFRNADLTHMVNPNAATPLSSALADAMMLGITQGGNGLSFETEMREIEFDGKRGKVKDATEMLSGMPSLSTTLKEFSIQNLSLAFPSTITQPMGNGFTRLTIEPRIDYHDNFVWVGTHGARDQPIVVVVKNAMNTANVSASFQDKNDATLAMTLEGSYGADGLIPLEIYMATQSIFTGILSSQTVTLVAAASQPSTADVTFTPAAVNGFEDDIELTLTAPNGITMASDPITIEAPYSGQDLTINSVEGLTAGTYGATLVATVAKKNITQVFPFSVVVPAPA